MKTKEWKQRAGVAGAILLMHLCVSCLSAWGQASTSRQIPFNNVSTTIAPGTTGQTLTLQLWDAPTAGNQLYCEIQTLDVTPGADGVTGVIAFNFGAGVVPPVPCPSGPPELKPADFVSGQSRFLDVVDSTGASVLPSGARIPLKAVAFAINPGPQGPAGPAGAQGPQGTQGIQGPPGPISNVIAGTGLAGGGTTSTVSVAIADSGVGTAQLAARAVTGAKVSTPLVVSASVPPGSGVLEFTNTDPNGVAVRGISDAGWGVVGISNTGTGVQGQGSASSGNTIGVRGVSFSPTGIGVSGEATHIGVFGRGSPAGLFQGNVQVLGDLSATNLSGNGSGLTGVTTSGLAAGTYSNAYNFSNPANAFSGNGAALTGVVASGLAPGNYNGAYHFTNGLSTFGGSTMTASSMSAGNLSATGNLSVVGGTVAVDSAGVPGGRFTILPNGNVGIGTPNPTANLDVAGVTQLATLAVGSVSIGRDAQMSSAPHMNFSGSITGTLCRDDSCGVEACGGCIASYFRPDRDIQITRISSLLSYYINPSCRMHDIYIAFDPSSFTTGYRVSLPVDSGFGDSGPLSVNVNSGQELWLVTWVGQCTVGSSAGGGLGVNVQYVMR